MKYHEDNHDPQLPDALTRALKASQDTPPEVPTELDEQIIARARQQFSEVRAPGAARAGWWSALRREAAAFLRAPFNPDAWGGTEGQGARFAGFRMRTVLTGAVWSAAALVVAALVVTDPLGFREPTTPSPAMDQSLALREPQPPVTFDATPRSAPRMLREEAAQSDTARLGMVATEPTILDVYHLARLRKAGDASISQADIDALASRVVRLNHDEGGPL